MSSVLFIYITHIAACCCGPGGYFSRHLLIYMAKLRAVSLGKGFISSMLCNNPVSPILSKMSFHQNIIHYGVYFNIPKIVIKLFV